LDATDPQLTHPAAVPTVRLLADCAVERTRRSGPGGQHRNKVETAVVITHRPTGARAEASERRSQAENHSRAVFRLRVELALQVRTTGLDAPGALWRGRVVAGRLAVSPSHDDFPALLAEALDVLAAHQWSPTAAGQRLGASGSQLVKLLKLEPRALVLLNAQRRSLGLPALK
jgi:hypothetical protein